MKWFKHYSDASRGETMEKIFNKFGLEGEARYWRLIELLSYRFDGTSDSFAFSLETIRQSLRHRSLTDCRLFLDQLATFSTLKVEYSGNDCLIKYDKIMKIKDNHHKNLPATSKQPASNLPLDKNRIEENRIDKNKRNIKEKSPSKKSDEKLIDSPLSFLFTDQPEIKKWLGTGMKEIQDQLISTYKEDYLRETILNAYAWQAENTKRKAGTFLKAWIERDKNKKIREEADPLYKFFISQGCVPQSL